MDLFDSMVLPSRRVLAFLAVLIFALISVVVLPSSGVFADTAPVAFSTEESDWHSVTIDLGSSVLVRIYGKIVSEETPQEISVNLGEHGRRGKNIYLVNTWIGDSKGNQIESDAAERYLVIEGTAANMADAVEVAVHGISYTIEGIRYAQFEDAPMEPRAVSAAQDQDSGSGGCSTGWSGVGAVGVVLFAFSSFGRRGKKQAI